MDLANFDFPKDMLKREKDPETTWAQQYSSGEVYAVATHNHKEFFQPINDSRGNPTILPICRQIPESEVQAMVDTQREIWRLEKIVLGAKATQFVSALDHLSKIMKSPEEFLKFVEQSKKAQQPLTDEQIQLANWLITGYQEVIPAKAKMEELIKKMKEIGTAHLALLVKQRQEEQAETKRKDRQQHVEEVSAAVEQVILGAKKSKIQKGD